MLNVPVPKVLLVEWWKSLLCINCCKDTEDVVDGGTASQNENEDAKLGDDPQDAGNA